MRVSLKDVASHAGVSIKTVSNVVNDQPHVTPAMRARVQKSIDELGYRPNLTARHLRKGRTGIVARPARAGQSLLRRAGRRGRRRRRRA